MKLHFNNDWLQRTTATDTDVDIEAGTSIDGIAMVDFDTSYDNAIIENGAKNERAE
jgi:hypothetical protein